MGMSPLSPVAFGMVRSTMPLPTLFAGKVHFTVPSAKDRGISPGVDGTIRILKSKRGKKWTSAGLLSYPDIDLRDPKLSIMPDGRLMVSLGGSNYDGSTLLDRMPYVSFLKSRRGEFSTPIPIVLKEATPEDWLWRVTWHEGVGYGVVYRNLKKDPWAAILVKTMDGIHYDQMKDLGLVDRPNEATIRFNDEGEMFIIIRNESPKRYGQLGRSNPPYADWAWHRVPHKLGGPNMIFMKDGSLIMGTRQSTKTASTVVGLISETGEFTTYATLPSGGDTSYPGFVVHKGKLRISYYSSHEEKTSIYLATISLKDIAERTAALKD